MNNEQFRRLLFDNPQPSSKPSSTSPVGQSPPNNQSHASRTGSAPGGLGGHALGSRNRSSIPMTPRTLTKPDFARQLAEYRRDEQNPPPNKKFKSSAAPKGTKLPAGYQDRAARLRELEGGNDAKDKTGGGRGDEGAASGLSAEAAEKLKILETRFKKGVIDEATFLQRRRELGVGGDLGSTHMVKGLDWDLLRRVRAGEDLERREKEEETRVEDRAGDGEDDEGREEIDVDEEFDKVLDGKEEAALPSAPREREKKRGSMAPPPAPGPTGRKTRDEILRELKASRAAAAAEAAAAAQENALGARFKKIGDSRVEKKRFIEQDESGRRREVLLITDAEGKTKRKTRWLDKPGESAPAAGPAAASKEAEPLGMEVPPEIAAKAARAKAAQDAEDEDDDIFAGVGADYNPLGDAGSDGDSSGSEEEGEVATKAPAAQKVSATETAGEPTKSRNYFATTSTQEENVESDRTNPLTKDPVLLAALKRAASLRQASGEGAAEGEDEAVDRDTLLRRKKFLEEARRREELDAMDMDYGFGGSRGEDDEDDEQVILQETRGGTKRKRGPKKKRGDKDSAADVLSVLEGRKKT
ncbi:hypothetical protein BJX63DRAFT_400973 [Aspergillus granulosus]|uniref:RED-like N-terminal domain-containing protein n=1 Tax=Aspergillus granulosus TaxID=176169 RepID=A0ABR4H5V2_9EURO